MTPEQLREAAQRIFRCGIDAANGEALVRKALRRDERFIWANDRAIACLPSTKIYVIAAGKAAIGMTRAALDILDIAGGVVVTKYGHAQPLPRVSVIESGHPIPDANSVQAGETIRRLVSEAGPDVFFLFLLSGGATSLFLTPPPTIPLNDIQLFFRLILHEGMNITELNMLRKTLSMIHGGRLARMAARHAMASLILSDVPGDDVSIIGSGPTTPDTSSMTQLNDTIQSHHLRNRMPPSVRVFLDHKSHHDFVRAGAACFQNKIHVIVGNNETALRACASKAAEMGFETTVRTQGLFGESRERGREMAAWARLQSGGPARCLVMGGESFVTVKGSGLGGRNQELALAALCEMSPADSYLVAACASDGTDGETNAAGAIADSLAFREGQRLSLEPREFLDRNDSHSFFLKIQSLMETGPTDTNVMDIAVALTPGNEPS